MAPRVGFEPTTSRLTAGCSTAELPGIIGVGCGRSPKLRHKYQTRRVETSIMLTIAERPWALEAGTGIEPMYRALQAPA
jgi:hypothetical protein